MRRCPPLTLALFALTSGCAHNVYLGQTLVSAEREPADAPWLSQTPRRISLARQDESSVVTVELECEQDFVSSARYQRRYKRVYTAVPFIAAGAGLVGTVALWPYLHTPAFNENTDSGPAVLLPFLAIASVATLGGEAIYFIAKRPGTFTRGHETSSRSSEPVPCPAEP